MEAKHATDGLDVPSGTPFPKLMPRPSHLTCAVISKSSEKGSNSKVQIARRKIEQACDLCRKKKVKCDGRSPVCASCKSHKAECSFAQILKKKKRQEKSRSLDLMAERIERMECMLRQRGFLKDHQGKPEVTDEDLEGIIDEIGKDAVSVPSLCGTGLDSTIQTGVTLTPPTNMEPPPIPDNAKAFGYVEKWLEGLPPFLGGSVRSCTIFEEPAGDNG